MSRVEIDCQYCGEIGLGVGSADGDAWLAEHAKTCRSQKGLREAAARRAAERRRP